MKAIVFGGSGFLGSHVCDALTKGGHEVTIFDKTKSAYITKGQKMIVGDVLNRNVAMDAVKGHDIVYNFAGIADMYEARTSPVDTVEKNVLGNTILLEAAKTNEVKRYVFASSIYVYSHLGSFYRASKQACEIFVESYKQAYNLKYTVLRYGSLYGPRANENNWIRQILKEALCEKRITRYGDGEEIREYIHVEDAARCSVEILSKEYENEYVVIAGHQQMKIKDLLAMVREILNNKVEIVYRKPEDKGDIYSTKLHYEMTPYSFKPRIAKKIISRHYLDLGQGILSTLNELHSNEEHTLYSRR